MAAVGRKRPSFDGGLRPEAAVCERQVPGRPVRGSDAGNGDCNAMLLVSSTETPPKRGLIVLLGSLKLLAQFEPPHEADTGKAEAEQRESGGLGNSIRYALNE